MTVLLSIMMPAIGNAQNFKNDVENLGKSLNELKEATNELFTLFKKKDRSVASDAATSSGVQQGGFRIVTGHPDIKVKIQRCEVSGSTCVIDFIIQNTSSADIDFDLIGGRGYIEGGVSKAYDDEGNMYSGYDFLVGFGSELNASINDSTLPAGISRKARIQIKGLSTAATKFLRIDLRANSKKLQWHVSTGHTIRFENVPITHEGDE